jgi:hypothetical protein
MRASVAKCQRHECHNTVTQPQSGRRKRFCSDACRIRVHRCNETSRGAAVQPAKLNAPVAFPSKTASFVTSKINDLDTLKNRGSVSVSGWGIVGCTIQAEVINGRDWEEVVSSGGVVLWSCCDDSSQMTAHDSLVRKL